MNYKLYIRRFVVIAAIIMYFIMMGEAYVKQSPIELIASLGFIGNWFMTYETLWKE